MAATDRYTVTPSNSETASTFSCFLASPPELRNMIYDLVIIPNGPVIIWRHSYRNGAFTTVHVRIVGRQLHDRTYLSSWERLRYSRKCDLSIIRVNKLLHLEATRRFYSMVHFTVFSPTTLSLFLKAIGPRNKACITTICLGVEFLDRDVENMDGACETLSSLPRLNKLVVYIYVKLFSLEYLDRRAEGSEWHVQKWTARARVYASKLLLFAKLLVSQGADEDGKRRMLNTLEIKDRDEYRGNDFYLLRHYGYMNGRAGGGRVNPTCEELAAGLRDDIEKLLVKSDYQAASSGTYDTEPVWLK